MDRHLAGESIAAGFLAFAPQTGFVAEIHIDGVDGLHFRGRGAGDAKGARQAIKIEEISVLVAVGFRSDFGGNIFGAPCQSGEAGA